MCARAPRKKFGTLRRIAGPPPPPPVPPSAATRDPEAPPSPRAPQRPRTLRRRQAVSPGSPRAADARFGGARDAPLAVPPSPPRGAPLAPPGPRPGQLEPPLPTGSAYSGTGVLKRLPATKGKDDGDEDAVRPRQVVLGAFVLQFRQLRSCGKPARSLWPSIFGPRAARLGQRLVTKAVPEFLI